MSAVVFLDDPGRWLAFATSCYSVSIAPKEGHHISIWGTDSARPSLAFSCADHDEGVNALAISSDRTWLASASSDTIRLWSVEWSAQGPHLARRDGTMSHLARVRSLVFRPAQNPAEPQRLFSGSDDLTIKIWDPSTCTEVMTLRGQLGSVTDLAFDPAGERLASASQGFDGTDNVARLWETEQAPEVRQKRAAFMRAYAEVRQTQPSGTSWEKTEQQDREASPDTQSSQTAK